MRYPNKFKYTKLVLAWIAMPVWLACTLGALWAMEKENVKIGATCSVKQTQSIQDKSKNGNQ
jgi:hypothetical protein